MPLFEYVCRDCSHRFEALVSASETPECASCHGKRLNKQLSVFGVGRAAGGDGASAEPVSSPCGSCGDPRGPGSCQMN